MSELPQAFGHLIEALGLRPDLDPLPALLGHLHMGPTVVLLDGDGHKEDGHQGDGQLAMAVAPRASGIQKKGRQGQNKQCQASTTHQFKREHKQSSKC